MWAAIFRWKSPKRIFLGKIFIEENYLGEWEFCKWAPSMGECFLVLIHSGRGEKYFAYHYTNILLTIRKLKNIWLTNKKPNLTK